jgi:hypothetical protein
MQRKDSTIAIQTARQATDSHKNSSISKPESCIQIFDIGLTSDTEIQKRE